MSAISEHAWRRLTCRSELPNYDLVIPALMKGGIEGMRENCKLTPGESTSNYRQARAHLAKVSPSNPCLPSQRKPSPKS